MSEPYPAIFLRAEKTSMWRSAQLIPPTPLQKGCVHYPDKAGEK